MRTGFIVFGEPGVKVGLQLVERGRVEALADAVGLRTPGPGAAVVDVLDREIELVLVPLRVAAVFAAAVDQHAQELDLMLPKNGSTRSLMRSAAVIGILRS